jgi:hypothetical protein
MKNRYPFHELTNRALVCSVGRFSQVFAAGKARRAGEKARRREGEPRLLRLPSEESRFLFVNLSPTQVGAGDTAGCPDGVGTGEPL